MKISYLNSFFSVYFSSFERYIRICYYCQLRSSTLLTDDNLKWYKLFLVAFPLVFYVPKFFEVRVMDTEEVNCGLYLKLGKMLQSTETLERIRATSSEEKLQVGGDLRV